MTVLLPMVDEVPATQALVTYCPALGSAQVLTVVCVPSVLLVPASQAVVTYSLGAGSWHELQVESEVAVQAVSV